MSKFYYKNKAIIAYLFFGVCTTVINWGSYYICYNLIKITNVLSTFIAWVLAVMFAFITNKIWVFNSNTLEKKALFYEIWTFLAARLATGLIDVIIMYFTVDVLAMNSTLWKLISNVIVIVINYILSKLIVFKNAKRIQYDKTHNT